MDPQVQRGHLQRSARLRETGRNTDLGSHIGLPVPVPREPSGLQVLSPQRRAAMPHSRAGGLD